MSRFTRCATAAAVLALALPGAASAADWRDGGIITDPDKQAQPLDAVVGGSGDAAFAWSGYFLEGSHPQLRSRPREGALGATAQLSNDSESLNATGNFPEDDLLLFSDEPLGIPRRVLVRSGTVQTGVGPSQTLYGGGDADRVCFTRAALGPGGRAIVLYAVAPPDASGSADFNRCSLRMRVRPGRDAAFGPEVPLSDPTRLDTFSAAFDGAGRAVVAWVELTSTQAMIRAVRVDPGGAPSPPQDIAVPGETPSAGGLPQLDVAANGRALIAFASNRPGNEGTHAAAALGDTTNGFGAANILSGGGAPTDAALGDDGTAAVVWQVGFGALAKVQGAVVGPDQPLTSAATDTLSGQQARDPRVAVGAGRASVAWFRLVSGAGRSIEMSVGRPGGFGRARRISESVVSARPPVVVTSDSGASWFVWAERPAGTKSTATVVAARKLTVTTEKLSRLLDVLRARTSLGEQIGQFQVQRSNDDAMVAVVARQRPSNRPSQAREFWQLRTYGE